MKLIFQNNEQTEKGIAINRLLSGVELNAA